MTRKTAGWATIALLLIAVLAALPSGAVADERPAGTVPSSGIEQDGADILGVFDIFRTYSAGCPGFGCISFSISSTGNVVSMRAQGAGDFINEGVRRSGYEVCYVHPTFGFTSGRDLAESGTVGMGAPAVLLGCAGSRFPCEITRLGPFSEIRITRRITGNSFVGPAPGNPTYDPDGSGVGCDTLLECGNATNRTLHVVTRVTNLTGVTLGTVEYQEIVDFDMFDTSGTRTNEIMVRTDSSMAALSAGEDARQGALLQGLILDPLSDAFGFGGTLLDCNGAIGITPTPTGLIDGEARLLFLHGSLGPGSTTPNNFRVHFRAF